MKKNITYIEDCIRRDRLLTYHVLEDQAFGKNANNIFLVFEGQQWTYRQFFDIIQRVGNWLMNDLGIQKTEVVAINGGNSPEYLMLWFGLEAIGGVPSFINCNLTAAPLIHCVKTCESRYLISDQDVAHLVTPCEAELASLNVKTIFYTPSFMAGLSDTTPTPEARRSGLDPGSLRCLIYTSGTTVSYCFLVWIPVLVQQRMIRHSFKMENHSILSIATDRDILGPPESNCHMDIS